MPAAQGEVTNREVRFTLRFRRTITIAAGSVSSPFLTGQAVARRPVTGSSRWPGVERLLSTIRGFTASRIPNSRAMTRLEQQAEAKQPTPADDQYEAGKTLAPDA
jgi:hypothetical protein